VERPFYPRSWEIGYQPDKYGGAEKGNGTGVVQGLGPANTGGGASPTRAGRQGAGNEGEGQQQSGQPGTGGPTGGGLTSVTLASRLSFGRGATEMTTQSIIFDFDVS
jgi:hypothetical protein